MGLSSLCISGSWNSQSWAFLVCEVHVCLLALWCNPLPCWANDTCLRGAPLLYCHHPGPHSVEEEDVKAGTQGGDPCRHGNLS